MKSKRTMDNELMSKYRENKYNRTMKKETTIQTQQEQNIIVLKKIISSMK